MNKTIQVIKTDFSPVTGNGYSLCRTSIHNNNFSVSIYTYIED